MRILHINSFLQGGAANASILLHKTLLENGYDSYYLSISKNEIKIPNHIAANTLPSGFIDKLLNKLNIILNKKKFAVEEQVPPFMFSVPVSYFLRLKIFLEKNRFDIIHLHWAYGLWDFKWFNKLNAKFVITNHDMGFFTAGCSHSYGCIGYISNCNNCPAVTEKKSKQKIYNSFLYKQKFLQSSIKLKVINVSDWVKSVSLKSKLLNKFEHVIVENAVDTKIFNYQASTNHDSVNKQKINLLFIAAKFSYKNKGYFDLLEAYYLIKEEIRNKINIIVVGNDDVGADEHFTHIDLINEPEKLANLYNACDILIYPSHAETQSLIVSEALCCGLPVIAYKIGPLPDIINEESGFVIEKSPMYLAQSIEMLTNIKVFNREFISTKYKERFSTNKLVEKTIQLYQSFS
ncbi:MAG: glycosyltransferase [Bacteroidetes bacterium]|nr:glycosyltransferase [Bacteroidota bacterium]MBS1649272.1 glycosyltransferase [Bacteroidota bacterium]